MISPHLHGALARANADAFRRAAEAHRRSHPRAAVGRPAADEASVTLRLASGADQRAIERLAQLDSSTPPAHPVLLADVDGHVHAAVGLADHVAIADPFH